jgi:hypothetical protein
MQTDPSLSVKSAFILTFKHEGARGFFKGIASPLSMQPITNSIVFGSYEFSKRYLGVTSE